MKIIYSLCLPFVLWVGSALSLEEAAVCFLCRCAARTLGRRGASLPTQRRFILPSEHLRLLRLTAQGCRRPGTKDSPNGTTMPQLGIGAGFIKVPHSNQLSVSQWYGLYPQRPIAGMYEQLARAGTLNKAHTANMVLKPPSPASPDAGIRVP